MPGGGVATDGTATTGWEATSGWEADDHESGTGSTPKAGLQESSSMTLKTFAILAHSSDVAYNETKHDVHASDCKLPFDVDNLLQNCTRCAIHSDVELRTIAQGVVYILM